MSGLTSVQTQTQSLHDTNTSLQVQQPKNNTTPVEIKRIIRRMRGGSQACLVEGHDGRNYVAKFARNPQGNRTLVNEWIAYLVLRELGICTPELRVLQLPSSLRNKEICFEVGNKQMPVTDEWHLGSVCPVNPEAKAIFDFLPRRLLSKLGNIEDFARIFVFDRWFYQTDARQAIFIREPGSRDSSPYRAYFIDHGMVFSGANWELRETTGHGLYSDWTIYSLVNMRQICEQTVLTIESLSEEDLVTAFSSVPEVWLGASEREALETLIRPLLQRRKQLRRIVANQLTAITPTDGLSQERTTFRTVKKPAVSTGIAKTAACIA